MQIVLAAEHALLREGLRDLLKRWSNLEIVGVAPAATDGALLVSRLQPDVFLLVHSASTKSDAEAVATVRSEARGCKIVLVETAGRRVRRGDIDADRYVPASVGFAGLVRILWETHAGDTSAASRGPGERSREGEPERLITSREYEIVQAVCEGLTNKTIARRLNISEKTVKNHLTNIYKRINLSGRTELVAWAMRRGLVVSELGDE